MNYEDIMKEYRKDFEIICEKLKKEFDKLDNKIKRLYYKTKKPVPIKTRVMKIRGTTYNIAINDLNISKDLGKVYFILHPFIITNDLSSEKRVSIVFTENNIGETMILIVEPHLLKRYRERYLNLESDEITYEELVSEFLKKNQSYLNIEYFPVYDKKDPEKIIVTRTMSKVKDGVVFGRVESKNIIRLITFISNEQVRESDQGDYVEGGYYDKLLERYKNLTESM